MTFNQSYLILCIKRFCYDLQKYIIIQDNATEEHTDVLSTTTVDQVIHDQIDTSLNLIKKVLLIVQHNI